MSAELWSTTFAGGTFIVIAATAVAALIQLRHLRASNQLNALLTLMRLWQAPELQEHIAYLRNQLQQKMNDPAFLAEFRVGAPSRVEHPELLVADFWEQVGAFMKFDLMDERSWLDARPLRSSMLGIGLRRSSARCVKEPARQRSRISSTPQHERLSTCAGIRGAIIQPEHPA